LIENVTHERRYTAARYAVMAASGLGDGKGLADAETAKLRKQAVEWLAGELTGWKKVLAVGSDDDKALARERLTWWKEDPKLAVIRYPDQLGKLPPDEQPAAKALWDGVNDALATPPK
jgi:hypothetical protein